MHWWHWKSHWNKWVLQTYDPKNQIYIQMISIKDYNIQRRWLYSRKPIVLLKESVKSLFSLLQRCRRCAQHCRRHLFAFLLLLHWHGQWLIWTTISNVVRKYIFNCFDVSSRLKTESWFCLLNPKVFLQFTKSNWIHCGHHTPIHGDFIHFSCDCVCGDNWSRSIYICNCHNQRDQKGCSWF